jgi:hypothetical protein
MLSVSIDGSDDDLASLISESFGPEAISAAIADAAREALAEAEAINNAALANEDRINIGARPAIFRETRAIRFVVHILSMSGLNDTIALVDTLRDFFREQEFGGVSTFEASPAAFDKSNRSGAFYLLPFVVTYRFDLVR